MTKPWDFTDKATPVDADRFPFVQSPGGSGDERRSTWANIKATLKAYFDTLYDATGAAAAAQAAAIAAAATDATTKANAAAAASTPIAHAGSGGTAHADAVASGAAGFLTGADKAKLDGIAAGASAAFKSLRTVTATGNITVSDANGVVILNGAGITATFVRTSFVANDRVLLINIGTATVTISAGADGFNTAGNDSFSLFPGEERWVVYQGSADPYWRTAIPATTALTANQGLALNNAGTAFEARTDKRAVSLFLPITANVSAGAAEGQLGLWPNVPVTLTEVSGKCLGGSCSMQIRKNGSAINGFGSAVAQTTSVTDTASTEAIAEDAVLDVIVTSASSLTGLFITFKGVRTGA